MQVILKTRFEATSPEARGQRATRRGETGLRQAEVTPSSLTDRSIPPYPLSLSHLLLPLHSSPHSHHQSPARRHPSIHFLHPSIPPARSSILSSSKLTSSTPPSLHPSTRPSIASIKLHPHHRRVRPPPR
ncbi:hypothetical protein CC85DRAFT_123508 [Cutaneotrichosporon oleaginosum]|uniref:Uncharacterized protein n=1 Tax=Cutaneotrichosporon oleaginosum TaxID=879819 RepID=A0A0J0XJS0_9TREE|nr:uncharacterized protein CC85DRAFT_123508 [Cutaneotrichosporon oleaginosum]KLT41360.1 hypothetical protein CC85DRAFT_123508 [Cutaneotrichosporon oleaginosum]TXT06302.1 hypothetical protein COLE_05633 [Cutaneotrichosporon oleaginosum]